MEQSTLQEHLISSLHALEASGIVTQTGTHESDILVQAKSCGPLAVFLCRSSRFLLDTLHVGHAGVAHHWWVAVCPLLDSCDRGVPFLYC